MDPEAIMIFSRKDLHLPKPRRQWTSPLCPPRDHQELHLGGWITLYLDITLPAKLSVLQTSCPTLLETHLVQNPIYLVPCTPCQQKCLDQVLHFHQYRSMAVVTMATTCHIHQKWMRLLYGSFKHQELCLEDMDQATFILAYTKMYRNELQETNIFFPSALHFFHSSSFFPPSFGLILGINWVYSEPREILL